MAHVEPMVGHVYLLRFEAAGHHGTDDVVKFQVIAHRPGEAVTFRWDRLASL